MIRFISFAAMLMLASLSATQTAHAQFLSDRLVPPHQVTLPPIPLVGQPAEPRQFGAEKIPAHLWSLPYGSFPGNAVTLPTETGPVSFKRPVLDVPTLASESDPVRPTFPVQPTAPKVFAVGPNPEQPPGLARFPQTADPAVLAGDDPSDKFAFALLTTGVPLATPVPIPLLRLSIPDPFEHIRAIRPRTAPADSDDPSTAQDRPPVQKLPNVEPPK